MRAVALLSGGLDSILAVRLILDQGVEVEALNFLSVFCTCTPRSSSCSAAKSAVRQLGVDLKVTNTTDEFLEIVKRPKHGYGRNLNPCLDCRIMMFRRAGEHMRKTGASFLVTGEVLGERPMSQRRDAMRIIEKEAGLDGLIVRPLSAALLEPSIPEKEGWIDRSKLLAIAGRSRKPQIALAKSYSINDYPCPAGGCLLTVPSFTERMRDLMRFTPDFCLSDVRLLKVGRHFRLSDSAKAVVARNDVENDQLLELTTDDDVLMETADFTGPLTVVRGEAGDEDLLFSAAITARYSKTNGRDDVRVVLTSKDGSPRGELRVSPAEDAGLAGVMITLAPPKR